MPKTCLDHIARERKESYKGDKSGYPIVGLEHLIPQEITLTNWSDDVNNTFTKTFRKGDILFGRRRAYLKKAVVAPFDGICSGDITVIEPKPQKIVPELLPFIIQNDDFFDYAVEKSAGSLSPRVKWEHLKNYKFDLPSLEEQRKLADVLWAAEKTKQGYKKLLVKADELVEAKFFQMFGDHNCVSKAIKIQPLGEVCLVERGGSPRPIENYITNDEKGINWIKIGDADETRYISKTKEKIIHEGMKKSRFVYSGDLILSNSMSFGRPYILKIDGCIHDGWLVLHIDKDMFDAIYLQTYLGLSSTYMKFSAMAAGGIVNNLNSEIVKKLPVIIPSIEKQRIFSNFVQQNDNMKIDIQKSLDNLNAMTKALIKEN